MCERKIFHLIYGAINFSSEHNKWNKRKVIFIAVFSAIKFYVLLIFFKGFNWFKRVAFELEKNKKQTMLVLNMKNIFILKASPNDLLTQASLTFIHKIKLKILINN